VRLEPVFRLKEIAKPDQPIKKYIWSGEKSDEAMRGQLANFQNGASAADVQKRQKVDDLQKKTRNKLRIQLHWGLF